MKFDQNGNVGGHGPAHLESSGGAHESASSATDVELRSIIGFLVGLAIMTVVVYLLMLLMFRVMNSSEANLKGPPRPLALKEKDRLPPEPRLQSAPGFAQKLESEAQPKESEAHVEKGHAKDQAEPKDRTFELEKLQEKWQQDLKDGPKDSSGKVTGIGIDQAMEQLINENALPVRAITTATKAEDFGVDMPTAASSGRVTEKRKQ